MTKKRGNKTSFEFYHGNVMSWQQFTELIKDRPRSLETYNYLADRLGISWRRAYGWYDEAIKELGKKEATK